MLATIFLLNVKHCLHRPYVFIIYYCINDFYIPGSVFFGAAFPAKWLLAK